MTNRFFQLQQQNKRAFQAVQNGQSGASARNVGGMAPRLWGAAGLLAGVGILWGAIAPVQAQHLLTPEVPPLIAQTNGYVRRPLYYRNPVTPGSSFDQFLADLSQAVRDRDASFIRAIAHPDIRLSFGEPLPLSALELDDPNAPFWQQLERAIAPGCIIQTDQPYDDPAVVRADSQTVICPYTFALEGYDVTSSGGYQEPVYVVATNVNVRSQASAESAIVGQASREVLAFESSLTDSWTDDQWQAIETLEGWIPVRLPNGTAGFVSSRYGYTIYSYRAFFTDAYGDWQMMLFVSGD